MPRGPAPARRCRGADRGREFASDPYPSLAQSRSLLPLSVQSRRQRPAPARMPVAATYISAPAPRARRFLPVRASKWCLLRRRARAGRGVPLPPCWALALAECEVADPVGAEGDVRTGRGGAGIRLKKKCPRGVAFLRSVALCCVRGVGWLVGEMGQGAPVEGTCRAGSGGAIVPAVPPPKPSGSAPRAGVFPSWWLRGGRLVWHTVECVRDLARARRRLTTRCRWPLR